MDKKFKTSFNLSLAEIEELFYSVYRGDKMPRQAFEIMLQSKGR